MKKLSLLVALILCVTIGSVYATWFYAESTMQDATHKFKNLGITDVDINTQTGTISVTDTLILKIDDNRGQHKPGWDEDVDVDNGGNILIRFTPNSGAADTTFNCEFSIQGNEYNGQPIFSFTGIDEEKLADKQVISTTQFTYKVSGIGNKTIEGETPSNLVGFAEKTITLKSITDRLTVNEIVLPTITDYNSYKTALDGVVLKLTISEVTGTP